MKDCARIAIFGIQGVVAYAIVDQRDKYLVSQYRWNLSSGGYARSGNGQTGLVLMHRLILKSKKGQEVDHRDHNRRNNRRSNIRNCSRSQNAMNRIGKGACRGVYQRSSGRWTCRIEHGKQEFHLGTFDTKKEAIAARTAAEVLYRGEFAPGVKRRA